MKNIRYSEPYSTGYRINHETYKIIYQENIGKNYNVKEIYNSVGPIMAISLNLRYP
jgi:hypothetical protein